MTNLSHADAEEMKRGRAYHSNKCMAAWMDPCCCGVGEKTVEKIEEETP